MSYLHPITALLEQSASFNSEGPNEVQAAPMENGYSAAIIILTVFLIESSINRTQYIRNEQPPKKPLDFVHSTYPKSGFLEKLEELFVVRDAIAHNHVWEAQFSWEDQSQMHLISAKKGQGYGDKKFKKVLNPQTRKTRQFGLNLFPTSICRADAVLVLKTAVEFLLFLENEDRRYVYISPQPVKFNGRITTFVELVAGL